MLLCLTRKKRAKVQQWPHYDSSVLSQNADRLSKHLTGQYASSYWYNLLKNVSLWPDVTHSCARTFCKHSSTPGSSCGTAWRRASLSSFKVGANTNAGFVLEITARCVKSSVCWPTSQSTQTAVWWKGNLMELSSQIEIHFPKQCFLIICFWWLHEHSARTCGTLSWFNCFIPVCVCVCVQAIRWSSRHD